MKGTESRWKVGGRRGQGLIFRNPGLFNNTRQHYNESVEMDEAGRRRRQDAGAWKSGSSPISAQ